MNCINLISLKADVNYYFKLVNVKQRSLCSNYFYYQNKRFEQNLRSATLKSAFETEFDRCVAHALKNFVHGDNQQGLKLNGSAMQSILLF